MPPAAPLRREPRQAGVTTAADGLSSLSGALAVQLAHQPTSERISRGSAHCRFARIALLPANAGMVDPRVLQPHACDTPRSCFEGHDGATSDRSTAVVHESCGTPLFGPERSVSGPNPTKAPGTRGYRKAKVGPWPFLPPNLKDLQPEVDRLTRERSLVRTQPRPLEKRLEIGSFPELGEHSLELVPTDRLAQKCSSGGRFSPACRVRSCARGQSDTSYSARHLRRDASLRIVLQSHQT